MKITHGLPSRPIPGHPVLTIGNFDGQHLGHEALVRAVVDHSRRVGGVPSVLTFAPHPIEVLRPGLTYQYLSDFQDKEAFFRRLGIRELIVLPFTPDLAALLPEQFVDQVLVRGLGIRKIMVGENFVFGKGRMGCLDDLRMLGARADFSVEPFPPVKIGGEVVSSTRIRKGLVAGHVQEAARCLGRPYRLGGDVIRGERRGTSMGWPTANISLPGHRVIPADGIYATLAVVDGTVWPSVSYIGTRPTFLAGDRLLEVHIFDHQLDLYGKKVVVEFMDFVRGDQTFSDVGEMMSQMKRDGERARFLLAHLDNYRTPVGEASSQPARQ